MEETFAELYFLRFKRRKERCWFCDGERSTPAHYMGIQWNEMLEMVGIKVFIDSE
jgi:hypothetical protein